MSITFKSKMLEKERIKALGSVLVAECKSANYSLESIAAILESGADIDFKNSSPLYFAAKGLRFELVKHLINAGATLSDLAVSFIASMCDYKGFGDDKEQQFFDILDIVRQKRPKTADGFDGVLFTPYINNMAVCGRIDKLQAFMDRYSLSESQVANAIFTRIIFEIINHGHDQTLALVEKHCSWIDDKTLDLCVATDEWMVLEYIISKVGYKSPSITAVAEAIYSGHFITLSILEKQGYNFSGKPLFLEKACRAALTKGVQSLEFLLARGYKISDRYKGKTIAEHAIADRNAPLTAYLLEKMAV